MRTWLVYRLLRRLGLPLLWAWLLAYRITHGAPIHPKPKAD